MHRYHIYQRADLVWIGALAITYAFFARMVLSFATNNGNVTIFWFPGGLGLAALMLGGKRLWPGIWLGAYAAGMLVNDPPVVSAFIAVGNTLESLAGAWLLCRNKGFNISLTHQNDFFLISFIACIVATISALIGPTALLAAGYLNSHTLLHTFWHWWQADTLGIILATPLFLIWQRIPYQWFERARIVETLCFIGLTLLAGQIIFLDWFNQFLGVFAFSYWLYLILIWGAVRFELHGALLVIVMTTVQALQGAISGKGYFSKDFVSTGLQNFWFYMLIFTTVGITLALTFQKRKKIEAVLRENEANLDLLFSNMPNGFALHEVIRDSNDQIVDYRFLKVNTNFEKIIHLSQDKIIGQSVKTILPELEHFWIETYAQVVNTRQAIFLENYSKPLGQWFAVHAYCPKAEQFAVIIQDITDRKLIEQREFCRNHILELLAEDQPLSVILEAITADVESASPSLSCLLRLFNRHGTLIHTTASSNCSNCHEFFLNNASKIPRDNLGNHEVLTQADAGLHWSDIIQDKSGELQVVLTLRLQSTQNPSQHEQQVMEHTRQLIAIAIDRYRAREEQQLAALIYNNSSEAMFTTDAHNEIISVNPAFSKITGFPADRVVGQNPKFLKSGCHDNFFYKNMWQAINTTGFWQGEICNRRQNGELFTEWLTINSIYNENGQINRHVALFSDITKKKESEHLIWLQANFDNLTGLPNRNMFQERLKLELKKTQRTQLSVALMFLDLDRFKEVNDTLGHAMGDILLQQTAARLLTCVRNVDIVSRLSGDEFTIVLTELHELDCINGIAQKIVKSLAEPFYLEAEVAYISVSIGIALYPDDGNSIDMLLKNADQAMYAAKNQGRNRFCYFAQSMQDAALTRMRITNDLRTAIAEQQFMLVYQPIINLRNNSIIKAEALIRWIHPSNGLINPADFIPIAEDTGLINEIGDWVFTQAVRQVATWRNSLNRQFQISINKSPVQFYAEVNQHLDWFNFLNERQVSGSGIVIEITESLLMDVSNHVIQHLLAFRDAGIQVALDDFGTGYSSLAYLKKFDIDYLKIDQSFVRNLTPDSNDSALCEAIIVMAHKLGIKVIAEGIETDAQLSLLKAAGCDFGQGYLFSKPIPAPEFEQWWQGRCTDQANE